MSQEEKQVAYAPELKLAAVRRVLAGESVKAQWRKSLAFGASDVCVEGPVRGAGRSGTSRATCRKAAEASSYGKRSGSADRTRGVAGGSEADRRPGAQGWTAGVGTGFFSAKPCGA